jgi:hypothetical protein
MHCLAVKLCAVFGWLLATGWKISVVALAIVEIVIDVSVEMILPVEPGSRSDEYAAGEPLRAKVGQ